MSEDDFHVHGPHDHAAEHHGAQGDSFASRIAVMTAILATVGAVFSLLGGAAQNDALLYKNDAAIRKTESSDQWNLYQSKSNKENLAELGASLTQGETQEKYRQAEDRYKREKEDIKEAADGFDSESKRLEAKSEHAIHIHHRWAAAMTAIQISISLAAMTLLTRRKWLSIAMYLSASIGIVMALMAILSL